VERSAGPFSLPSPAIVPDPFLTARFVSRWRRRRHRGEGTTSSGVYENSGTIGQPDAGSVIAGEFVIGGGYWSDLEAVLQPGAAGLSIEELSPDSALITWPAPSTGYVLQENANLTTSNWLAVTNPPAVVNGEMQITASPTVGNRYCRLNYQP
jgi:hypothetical protein